MPTAEDNSPLFTEADHYGFVLTSLLGVIDDAEASHCNPKGIKLLHQANIASGGGPVEVITIMLRSPITHARGGRVRAV